VISTKLVKLTPAATQYCPCIGCTSSRIVSSCFIGSTAGPIARSACMNGSVSIAVMSGVVSERLMPNPSAMPVTKKAGGPPIGACNTPNAKNDAKPWPPAVVGWA